MPDQIIQEVWDFIKQPLSILIYLGIAYLAVKIFHKTMEGLVTGIIAELRGFVQPTPSARGLNALFAVFIFIAIILMFAAQEIAEAQQRESTIPAQFIFLIGGFLLLLFLHCQQPFA